MLFLIFNKSYFYKLGFEDYLMGGGYEKVHYGQFENEYDFERNGKLY